MEGPTTTTNETKSPRWHTLVTSRHRPYSGLSGATRVSVIKSQDWSPTVSTSDRPDRIALFFNGHRGITIAQRLAEAGHTVSAVVVHGAATASKGDLLRTIPDATFMEVDSTRWSDVARTLTRVKAEVGIVAGFSYLIPPEVLQIPKGGFLNLHAGPVPKYRGGSPLNWQMIEGERSIGISILQMTSGIDDGPVVAAGNFTPLKTNTIADVHSSANKLFGDLLIDILEDFHQAISMARPQHEMNATYWHQRSDSDGQINVWMQSAEEICRMVKALTHPYPGAWFTRDGDVFRVFAAEDTSTRFRGSPGRIIKVSGVGPVLIVRSGSIRLVEVACQASIRPLRNGDRVGT